MRLPRKNILRWNDDPWKDQVYWSNRSTGDLVTLLKRDGLDEEEATAKAEAWMNELKRLGTRKIVVAGEINAVCHRIGHRPEPIGG